MRELSADIRNILSCPLTHEKLQFKNSNYSTEKGEIYPEVNSIPWLIANYQYNFDHWLFKKIELLQYYQRRIQKIKSQLKQSGLSSQTLQRLNAVENSLVHNSNVFSEILKPLDENSSKQFSTLEKIPSHQSLSLYLKNVFRDWAWETDENALSLKAIEDVLPTDWHPDKFLIVGSGACRLSIDLHQKYKLKCSLATDINPLLIFVAQKILQGESITLYDLPTAPISLSQVAVKNTLNNPYKNSIENFHLLFADIQKLPFNEQCIDSVLSPWLIDILPMNFKLIAQRINRVLKINGEWINFGPLGFMHSDESHCYTFEEVQELLPTCGFKLEKYNLSQMPYLDCPYASQKRSENVICYRAIKVANVPVENFEYLPTWLLNQDEPIPLNNVIQELQIHSRIQADLSHSIDGKRSINNLTKLMSEHYKITEGESRLIITSLFTRLYESKNRNN